MSGTSWASGSTANAADEVGRGTAFVVGALLCGVVDDLGDETTGASSGELGERRAADRSSALGASVADRASYGDGPGDPGGMPASFPTAADGWWWSNEKVGFAEGPHDGRGKASLPAMSMAPSGSCGSKAGPSSI